MWLDDIVELHDTDLQAVILSFHFSITEYLGARDTDHKSCGWSPDFAMKVRTVIILKRMFVTLNFV